jgi:PKD repeat protein
LVIGQSQVDSFEFEAENYYPVTPISGGFAFFDVYQGGQKNASNGNGLPELAYLNTPIVKGSFRGESYFSFDYQFVRLRSASVGFEISADSGKSWESVWIDSVGRPMPESVKIRFDHLLKPTSTIQGRFYWKTNDTLLHQGYLFVDNVLIYNTLNHDAKLSFSHVVSTNLCFDDDQKFSVDIINVGSSRLDTSYINTQIFDSANVIYQQIDTVFNLSVNGVQTLPISNLSRLSSGSYNLVATIQSPNDIATNDTIFQTIIIGDSLKDAQAIHGLRCGQGKVWLEVSDVKSDSFIWTNKFDKPLGSGARFETDFLAQSDSFFLQTANFSPRTVETYQGPYRFNSVITGGSYFQIIAFNSMRITELAQHFASINDTCLAQLFIRNGGLVGHEQDTTGWIKYHEQQLVTQGWGTYVQMSIAPIYLESGDTLSVYLAFEGKPSFTFKKGLFNSTGSDISIYCDGINDKLFSQGGGLYRNYSWDGRVIYDKVCVSEPTLAKASISPTPQNASILPSSTFSGVIASGSVASPDETDWMRKLTYDINPPDSQAHNDYGTNWEISQVKFVTVAGKIINSGITWLVESNLNEPVQLIISVDSMWIDSILSIYLILNENGLNCDTTLTRSFRASESIIPSFSYSVACLNTMVEFTNQSSMDKNATYSWDFDDGGISNTKNAFHVFNKSKTYQIRLISSNQFGITDTVSQAVTVNIYPLSSIQAIHTCLGTPATLRNTSRNAPITNSYYVWLYKGDTIHKAPNFKQFVYSFKESGVHKVKLISNHQGCIDSSSKNVFQFEIPQARFEAYGDCQFDSFSILNLSSINSKDKLGYRWLYNGDNYNTIAHPKGIHLNNGPSEITLLATSEFNCSDTISKTIEVKPSVNARFSVGIACKNDSTVFNNLSLNPSSLLPFYVWDFGDGNNSQLEHPKHFFSQVGEKQVKLTARVPNGCQTRFDTSLVVRVDPNARFEFEDVCSGETATFINKSKVENKILRYQWFFGDGDSSQLHSPSHIYTSNEPALYVVRLKVYTDDGFCTDEFAKAISIFKNPFCTFNYQLHSDSLTYSFSPIDSSLTTYTWSFEGGGTSAEKSPIHQFQDKSTYLVRLFAENKFGCKCISEQQIEIGLSSIKSIKIPTFSVYPTPFNDRFTVESNFDKFKSIALFNAIGEQLKFESRQINLNSVEIQIANSASGVLFLQIQNEYGLQFIKLLKR